MDDLHSPTVVRAATEDDARQIRALLAEAFNLSVPDETTPPELSVESRWVLGAAGDVQATALSSPQTQWFGGSAVASGLVRAVAVGAPVRGSGIGRVLMRGVLQQERARGVAVSTLFPSVPGPYRHVGYEYAGECQHMTVALQEVRRQAGPAAERLSLDDLTEVRACYDTWAAGRSAAIGRSEAWWAEIVLTAGRTYLYGVREEGVLTGYVAYTKQPADGKDLKYYFDVQVQDAAWSTSAAGTALLGLLASHAGLGVDLRWPGHAGDLWSRALSSQAPRVAFSYPWMFRLIDVERALADRGYNAQVTASVALSVLDDVLPENAAAYQLDVENGKATVSRTTSAAATIDVGALAPLYTGYLTATELAAEGRITGASDEEVAALDRMFAGPRPMLAEMF